MTVDGRRSLDFDPIERARSQWVEAGWSDAADGMAAITSLMRAHQIVLARVEASLRPLGLTFARYEVLMLLWFSKRGSLPMKVIGSRLQVHPTSVTNAVDRLEDAGLVARSTHPDDRRAYLVALTRHTDVRPPRAATARAKIALPGRSRSPAIGASAPIHPRVGQSGPPGQFSSRRACFADREPAAGGPLAPAQ